MTPTQAQDLIAAMTDDELRAAAHQCEIDLHQAVEIDPQGDRHAECFAALYCMCVEKTKRGMKPKATGVLQ